MSDRLTTITTGGGDDGQSSLADGTRLPKHHDYFQALGDLDELNACLGWVLAGLDPADALAEPLALAQHRLFDLGAELAVPGSTRLGAAQVAELEAAQQALNAQLPPLREFLLPGGEEATARCQLARAVCRRAERSLLALAAGSVTVNPHSRVYLNRLSDLLFVIARHLARRAGAERCWEPLSGQVRTR